MKCFVRCVQEELEQLGASISFKLSSGVTHCVFKDGALSTYNKAKWLGVHIVSVTWIEACKNNGRKVDEEMFPTILKERFKGLFQIFEYALTFFQV